MREGVGVVSMPLACMPLDVLHRSFPKTTFDRNLILGNSLQHCLLHVQAFACMLDSDWRLKRCQRTRYWSLTRHFVVTTVDARRNSNP